MSDITSRYVIERHKEFYSKVPFKKSIALGLICLGLLFCLSKYYNNHFWTDYFNQNHKTLASTHKMVGLDLATSIASERVKGRAKGYKIDQMNLNVKFEDWAAITSRRNELISTWKHIGDEPYRKVTIDWKGKKLKGKIRLKGIGPDHREDEKKWSFAVNLKGDDYIYGASKFSLQDPETRLYWAECSYSYALRAQDILTPFCENVEVFVNGDRIGVMTLSERMSTELLESQGRKEGVIFKPSYAEIWERLSQKNSQANLLDEFPSPKDQLNFTTGMRDVILNRTIAPVEFYNASKLAKDPGLIKQQEIATGLYTGLLDGHLSPSEVFDVEKISDALAVTFFWGNYHSFEIHNLRFYLNPITLKLEPIPTDVSGIGIDQFKAANNFNNRAGGTHDLFYLIIKDPIIRKRFNQKVLELGEAFTSGEMFGEGYSEFSNEQLFKLRQDYPFLPGPAKDEFLSTFIDNKDKVSADKFFAPSAASEAINHNFFLPENFEVKNLVHAFIVPSETGYQLEVLNTIPQEVEILSIEPDIFANFDKIIPPTYKGIDPVSGRRLGKIVAGAKKDLLKGDDVVTIKVKPRSQTIVYEIEATKYYKAYETHPLPRVSLAEIINTYSFMKFDEAANLIVIESGDWEITKFISFPDGIGLSIEAGTILRFAPIAGLKVRGSIHFSGSETKPIIFTSLDDVWRGLTVMDSNSHGGAMSVLNHVEFNNTTFAENGPWKLTGAINFYKSDVSLQNVTFDTTIAEDALNIIHSKFQMNGVKILNSRSDGFDGDFTQGEIRNSEFGFIGGDGIDFSGSDIAVHDSKFFNVKDKAISVGEASNLVADSVQITASGTGIVSKDGSEAKVSNSEMADIQYFPLMTYTKKPQYGGAYLEAHNTQWDDHLVPIVQKGSEMLVDDKKMRPRKINIDKLYKEGFMKK